MGVDLRRHRGPHGPSSAFWRLDPQRQTARVETSDVELDNVLFAVADVTAAASIMEARYGLTSTEGGRHLSWGTANRIVPLRAAYLELVAVVHRAFATKSAFGCWVAH